MDKSNKQKLFIVSCSDRKNKTDKPVKAWDLYDGVFYRILKKDRYKQVIESLDIYILSAKYGLIPMNNIIENYDHKMTLSTAREQRNSNLIKVKEVCQINHFQEIFIAAGSTYLMALSPLEEWLPDQATFSQTSGKIGFQLQQLKVWLEGQLE